MDERKQIWIWRARRVDAHWEGGWSVLGDDRMREPAQFRRAVERVARSVLPQMVRDEANLRALEHGRSIDTDGVVEDVLAGVLPGIDPEDGVRLAVVKLQLAALEALDRHFRDDLMLDHPEVLDREFTDERGIVEFL